MDLKNGQEDWINFERAIYLSDFRKFKEVEQSFKIFNGGQIMWINDSERDGYCNFYNIVPSLKVDVKPRDIGFLQCMRRCVEITMIVTDK